MLRFKSFALIPENEIHTDVTALYFRTVTIAKSISHLSACVSLFWGGGGKLANMGFAVIDDLDNATTDCE